MAYVEEFKPILTNRTERVRRNLLVISVLIIVMFWFGKFPSKIPVLGVPIESEGDFFKLMVSLVFVAAYMLINFVCSAVADIRVWVDPIWERQDRPANSSLFGITFEQLEHVYRKSESDRFFDAFLIGSISTTFVFPLVLGVLAIGLCLAEMVI